MLGPIYKAMSGCSVTPIMMSDIGHGHIGGNLTHRRWRGNCASMSDVPNLQRRVYDINVAATECNRTQAHCASHNMPCMVAPLCAECSSPISGQWAPLQLSWWPSYDAPRPAVKSACNPIPVLMQCVVSWTVAAYWLPLYSDVQASYSKRMQLNTVSCIAYTAAFKRSLWLTISCC